MLIAPLWALLNSAAEWLFLVPLLPFLQRRSGNENRPGFAVSRERPAKTLWRHGTDRLLFDRGAGAAGARGRTIRERRLRNHRGAHPLRAAGPQTGARRRHPAVQRAAARENPSARPQFRRSPLSLGLLPPSPRTLSGFPRRDDHARPDGPPQLSTVVRVRGIRGHGTGFGFRPSAEASVGALDRDRSARPAGGPLLVLAGR